MTKEANKTHEWSRNVFHFQAYSLNIHILVRKINDTVPRLNGLAYREKINSKCKKQTTTKIELLMNRRNLHLNFDNLRRVPGKGSNFRVNGLQIIWQFFYEQKNERKKIKKRKKFWTFKKKIQSLPGRELIFPMVQSSMRLQMKSKNERKNLID